MNPIEQEYTKLKKLFPGTEEATLWKLAAESCYFEWCRNITFKEYLEILQGKIERYFSER